MPVVISMSVMPISHGSCIHMTSHLLGSRVLTNSNVAALDLLRFCCRMWRPVDVVVPPGSGIRQWEGRVPILDREWHGPRWAAG